MLVGITSMLTDLTMSPSELAVAVEERGFESLWLPEHSHIPTSRESPWPGSKPGSDEPLPYHYSRYVDLFVSLSMAAAVTSRIRLGSSVCLVAQHDPIQLAKQVATLDHLSGGRVILGIGYGWNREEAANRRRRRGSTRPWPTACGLVGARRARRSSPASSTRRAG